MSDTVSASRILLPQSLADVAPTLPVFIIFALCAFAIAWFEVFPSQFDELAHFSVIRSQWLHPNLFADTRTYGMLDALNTSEWTGKANYLNHPALYYLLLSPLSVFEHPVAALRIANVVLACLAYGIIVWAGCRLLMTTNSRVTFAILVACFPKFALVGGIINNDNLAMLAAALVFAGMTGKSSASWLIAVGLALAGWSKLTALISLASLVAVWTMLGGWPVIRNRANLHHGIGLLIGCVPFLQNFATTGELFHVNVAVFGVAPELRPHLNFLDYATRFVGEIVYKWPASEGSLPLWVCTLLIAIPFTLAASAPQRDAGIGRIALASFAALAITFAFHLGFGWRAFVTMGDLSIPQTRYYCVLWPGLALGATCTLSAMRALPRWTMLGLFILPTVIGGFAIQVLS